MIIRLFDKLEGSIQIFGIFLFSRVGLEPTAAAAEPRREPGLAAGRRVEGRQEQAAAAAEDALHVAAAAGAGGAVHAEQVPRHGHQGGDLHVDQHRRAKSQGE